MSKPYLSMYIADYIIEYCNDHGVEINNLKLQKIMYFLQARFLVESGEPLFEENMQKWKYGPVVPSVYHEYKKNGAANIMKEDIGNIIREPFEGETPNIFNMFVSEQYSDELIAEEDKDNINCAIDSMANFTGFELVAETHSHEIWSKDKERIEQGVQGIEYVNNEIKDYFIQHKEARLWE